MTSEYVSWGLSLLKGSHYCVFTLGSFVVTSFFMFHPSSTYLVVVPCWRAWVVDIWMYVRLWDASLVLGLVITSVTFPLEQKTWCLYWWSAEAFPITGFSLYRPRLCQANGIRLLSAILSPSTSLSPRPALAPVVPLAPSGHPDTNQCVSRPFPSKSRFPERTFGFNVTMPWMQWKQ
jgi:hypothetical protein